MDLKKAVGPFRAARLDTRFLVKVFFWNKTIRIELSKICLSFFLLQASTVC